MFSMSPSPGIWIHQFLPSSFTTRIPHFPSRKTTPNPWGFHPKPLGFTPNRCMGWEFPSYFFWGRKTPNIPSQREQGKDPCAGSGKSHPKPDPGGSGASRGPSQFILGLSQWESGPKIPLPNLELEISLKS